MSDFETHPRGTARELRLSRLLAEALSREIRLKGTSSISEDILEAYHQLIEEYNKQLGSDVITG